MKHMSYFTKFLSLQFCSVFKCEVMERDWLHGGVSLINKADRKHSINCWSDSLPNILFCKQACKYERLRNQGLNGISSMEVPRGELTSWPWNNTVKDGVLKFARKDTIMQEGSLINQNSTQISS